MKYLKPPVVRPSAALVHRQLKSTISLTVRFLQQLHIVNTRPDCRCNESLHGCTVSLLRCPLLTMLSYKKNSQTFNGKRQSIWQSYRIERGTFGGITIVVTWFKHYGDVVRWRFADVRDFVHGCALKRDDWQAWLHVTWLLHITDVDHVPSTCRQCQGVQ